MKTPPGLVATSILPIVIATTLAAASQGPTALRLRGRVLTGEGTGIPGATIETDAVAGFVGDQFVGQRRFKTTTNKKGEWSLLGITGGVWLFEVRARGYLPHVVALPIQMTQTDRLPTIPWYLSVAPQPEASAGGAAADLLRVADLPAQGGRAEAGAAFRRLQLEDVTPEVLCAAGDVGLLLREYAAAFDLFNRAVIARPGWYRPHLGVASAAMLQLDYETAGKGYWQARQLVKNDALEQPLSAAIMELGRITRYRWIRD